MTHFKAAATLCERGRVVTRPPQGTQFIAHCLRMVGECSVRCDNYLDAVHYAQRALDVLGDQSEGTGDLLNEAANCEELLGRALQQSARSTEAAAAYGRACSRFERIGGSVGDWGIVRVSWLQGKLCHATGNFEDGLATIQNAERRCLAIPGGPAVLSTLLNNIHSSMAGIFSKMGQHSEARVIRQKCLSYTEVSFGENYAATALALYSLAKTCVLGGDTEEALGYCARAIAINTRIGRLHSIPHAEVLLLLGTVHSVTGDYVAALELLKLCLALYRKILPADHHTFHTVFSCIAGVYEAMDQPEPAAELRAAAALILRRSQTNCANPGCKRQLREDGAPLDVCVKCRRTFYCGKACQTADWKREGGHKAESKALIAEGKAAGAGAAASPSG